MLRSETSYLWQYHSWISYEDAAGRGGCEPEAFALLADCVLLIECKLTGCNYGHAQMTNLYAPLLSHIFRRPVRCLQIARSLAPSSPGPFFPSLDAFIASGAELATFNWPGR